MFSRAVDIDVEILVGFDLGEGVLESLMLVRCESDMYSLPRWMEKLAKALAVVVTRSNARGLAGRWRGARHCLIMARRFMFFPTKGGALSLLSDLIHINGFKYEARPYAGALWGLGTNLRADNNH